MILVHSEIFNIKMLNQQNYMKYNIRFHFIRLLHVPDEIVNKKDLREQHSVFFCKSLKNLSDMLSSMNLDPISTPLILKLKLK